MRIDADAQLLGVYTHDAERCDAGQPCAMCQWANKQELQPWHRPTEADLRSDAITLAYEWIQREFPEWSNEQWDAKALELGGLIQATIVQWLEREGDSNG